MHARIKSKQIEFKESIQPQFNNFNYYNRNDNALSLATQNMYNIKKGPSKTYGSIRPK